MGAQLLGQKAPEPQEVRVHEGNQAAYAELQKMQLANQATHKELQNISIGGQSFAINLDPLSLIQTRLSAIMETLFPSDTAEGQAAQIQVEFRFEAMMANVLAEARRNAVSELLKSGMQVPPHMMEEFTRNAAVPPGFKQR